MSLFTFNAALEFTLHWEGGKSDDPQDPGGRTNFGITQVVYDRFRANHKLPLQSVFEINSAEVHTLYQTMFWSPCYAYLCAQPLATTLFDTAVNFNPSSFRYFVCAALGVKPPSPIKSFMLTYIAQSPFMSGEMIQAIKALSPEEQKNVALGIVAGRKAYRYERVQQNPSQKKFLQGWLNRDNSLESLIMAKE